MKGNKILKAIGKNVIVFIIGAFAAIVIVILFILPSALEKAGDKAGLGIIALAPVLLIIYGMIGIVVGGFGSVIIYNLWKKLSAKPK